MPSRPFRKHKNLFLYPSHILISPFTTRHCQFSPNCNQFVVTSSSLSSHVPVLSHHLLATRGLLSVLLLTFARESMHAFHANFTLCRFLQLKSCQSLSRLKSGVAQAGRFKIRMLFLCRVLRIAHFQLSRACLGPS